MNLCVQGRIQKGLLRIAGKGTGKSDNVRPPYVGSPFALWVLGSEKIAAIEPPGHLMQAAEGEVNPPSSSSQGAKVDPARALLTM